MASLRVCCKETRGVAQAAVAREERDEMDFVAGDCRESILEDCDAQLSVCGLTNQGIEVVVKLSRC